jgi:hypothetical protein
MGTPLLARLEAWYGRRSASLNSAGAMRKAAWLAPFVFGLLSVLLGQDDGWDMKNYHLYAPFAVLHDRLGFDLAPGQFQGYFNPTLDLLYYLLVHALPGPVAGFVMGALHGLNLVLLLAIGRAALPHLPPVDRFRVPLLLALCGICGVGFLSELGNSMGDNLTSLFVLAAVWLLLRRWDGLVVPGGIRIALCAGVLMGLGTGLKLTNATHAVGLCVALLVVPGAWWLRLRLACGFGIGVLAGIAVTAGWWFLKMWQLFGNPLFPQFNNLFKSPLAAQIGVIDNDHLPRSVWEALAWPLVFTAQFERVSELVFRQLIWTVVYLLCVALLVRMLRRRGGVPAGRERFLVVFFAVAFLAWMKLFGIHRYLVPIELLAPLVAWILLHALLAQPRARRLAGWVLTVCALVVFPFGTWGHTPWASRSFQADVPVFERPEQTVIVEFFPRQIRFASIGDGFPASDAWRARIRAALDDRSGPHYILMQGAKNYEESRLAQRLRWADNLGLLDDARGCARLQKITRTVRLRVQLAPPEATPAGKACTLELQPKYRRDLAAENGDIRARAGTVLVQYGLRMRDEACVTRNGWIGAEPMPYMLCPLERTARP